MQMSQHIVLSWLAPFHGMCLSKPKTLGDRRAGERTSAIPRSVRSSVHGILRAYMQVLCGGGRSRRRRSTSALTDVNVRLTLSARLEDLDDEPVTAGRQSRLLDTLDNVVDVIQTAAVDHRLLPVSGGDVTDVREVARTWEPVMCRDGEVRDDDDLSACCQL